MKLVGIETVGISRLEGRCEMFVVEQILIKVSHAYTVLERAQGATGIKLRREKTGKIAMIKEEDEVPIGTRIAWSSKDAVLRGVSIEEFGPKCFREVVIQAPRVRV